MYVVEDLRAGHDVALTIDRYEELARERWSEDSWRGRLCAVHAALAAARATSSREAAHADDYFSELSVERATAHKEGREPCFDHPADELEIDGKYNVAFDQHMYEGKKRGRGGAFFSTHGARVDPEEEPELSHRWRLRSMKLENHDYTDKQLASAVAPVKAEDRWSDSEDRDD